MIDEREQSLRRLVVLVGAVVFVDTMFYAAIAPLLPTLAHELHLSKLSAGVMTACYAAGTLVGALPGGILAARAGPRFAVCTGLGLLAVATIVFGLGHNVLLLDLARLVEGLGGACSWAGGIAWIVAEAPADRRGMLIGSALGAAIGGSLFGPIIGTVATALGRAATFIGVGGIAVGLIFAARGLGSAHVASGQGWREFRAALGQRRVRVGIWLMGLPAVASGMLNVLGPLRLHDLGSAAAVIGGTFLVAAAFEAVVSPLIGRVSDRHGRIAPMRFGLVLAAVLLACFTLPKSVGLLAVLIVLTVSAVGIFWAPAMALLSDVADDHGLDQALGAALMNLAWAGGQVAGSGGGGALARATSDAIPMLTASALCAVTLVALAVRRPRFAVRSGAPGG